jgi:FKBP-type peptidyl-prolyl cis-trans isomerase 2
VTLPRHVAADRHQRRGPERELLGTQQGRDEQVATGLESAVGAQRDPVAQVVPEQDLVDLGQTELPGRSDMLDRGERRAPVPPA